MKICVFGNKTTTKELILNLLKNNVKIETVVTLGKNLKSKFEISGGQDNMRNLCESHNITVYEVNTYSLKNPNDQCFFKEKKFDIGLSTGWQRLIPVDILKSFRQGVFGWHGSGFEFPNGRGRSPLNWSIRVGLKNIYHNCFKYGVGADDGDIFETKIIPIEESDYISDLQKKAMNHILDSSHRLIMALEKERVTLLKQPSHPSIVLPSLNERSGEIFRDLMGCKQTLQIVKSCSRPFPGAYLLHNKKKIRIWKAEIFLGKPKKMKSCVYFEQERIFINMRDGTLMSSDFQIE